MAKTSSDNITLEYNHALGAIEIVMPSKTRIACTKQSDGLVYALLNALHMLPKERQRIPLTQAQINKMVRDWKRTNIVTAPLTDAPKVINLEDIGL